MDERQRRVTTPSPGAADHAAVSRAYDTVSKDYARYLPDTRAGQLLVAFQAGVGTRDLGPTYRRFGHDVRLDRVAPNVGLAPQARSWRVIW